MAAPRRYSDSLKAAFPAKPAGMFVAPNGIGVGLFGLKGILNPGSWLRLRGQVDNSNYEPLKSQGEACWRKMALRAMKPRHNRANEIKRILGEPFRIDSARIKTVGRGWEEPAGTVANQNRRVEVLWFTLE